jgi:hypothetical protein
VSRANGTATACYDLFFRRTTEVIRMYCQLFCQFPVTEDPHGNLTVRSKPVLPKRAKINRRTLLEHAFQVLQIHFRNGGRKLPIRKTSLGNPPNQRHLTAFKSNTVLMTRSAASAFVTTT